MDGSIPLHIVRFGIHADSDSLELTKDSYELIIFNANMVQYTTKAIGSLIVSRLDNKPYMIDPGTHAFAQDVKYIIPSKKELKPENVKLSLQGLASSYGLKLGDPVGVRPLEVTDFDKLISIEEFTTNVINFQREKLQDELHDDLKYLPEGLQLSPPSIIIAPYFYLSLETIDEWLPLNVELAKISSLIINDQDLYAEIVISTDLLMNEEAVKTIVTAYSEMTNLDGFLIWISDFEEHGKPSTELSMFRDFVAQLAKSAKPIINLFGGYFSIMLAKYGLTGVAHGPGYGEHRHIVPVGGGPPTQKYYFSPAHERLDYATVQLLIDSGAWGSAAEFEKEVCSCIICESVIQGNLTNFSQFGETEFRIKEDGTAAEVMTSRARNLMKAHFIEAKSLEHQFVASHDVGVLAAQLKSAKINYSSYLGPRAFGHLDKWRTAIK